MTPLRILAVFLCALVSANVTHAATPVLIRSAKSGALFGAITFPFGVPYCQSKLTVESSRVITAGCVKDWMLKLQFPLALVNPKADAAVMDSVKVDAVTAVTG